MMPRWMRLPCWALGVSVLLHWALLDLARTPAPEGLGGAQPALQVRIVAAEPVWPVAVTAQAPVALQAAKAARRAVPEGTSSSTPDGTPGPLRADEAAAAQSVPVLAGLRSGLSEEALLAMRLALVAHLRESGAAGWPQGSVWVAFGAAGEVLAVRAEGLPAPLAARLRAMAGQLSVPQALQGRAFELSMRFQ